MKKEKTKSALQSLKEIRDNAQESIDRLIKDHEIIRLYNTVVSIRNQANDRILKEVK